MSRAQPSEATSRVSAHWVVMGVLFAAALGIGYVLLPGRLQRVAMLERDGQTQQARDLLENSYNGGDRSTRTLLQLQAVYEQLGQLDKARDLLQQLQLKLPQDLIVLKRAASFYKMTQDEVAYIRTLQAQLDLKYSDSVCRELVGLLRLHGSQTDEQLTIQNCRKHGYRRAEDLVRLASLVAADGDLIQASSILRSVDDVRRLKSDRDRTTLLSVLLEIDQPREAYRRAVRWLRGARETVFALTVINIMAVANKHDLGIQLAREISAPGDSVSLTVAELMLDRGEPMAARSFLRGWVEKARFTSVDLISRFIVACLDAEDPENALIGAKRFGLGEISQPDLVALAEALAATNSQADFDLVRAAINPDVLNKNALLGAAIALQRGAPEASQTLLSTVAVDDLDEWRLSLWARLMDRSGQTAAAVVALQRLGVEQLPAIVPDRITLEPRMIRRPARATKIRLRRFPSTTLRVRPQAAPTPPLVTPGAPYDFNRGG